jgi:hypothetical protein
MLLAPTDLLPLAYSSIDVFGATTSPPLDIGRACRQLEMMPVLPALFGDGLQTCVPCPPGLLGHVIVINHLRAQLCGSAAGPKKKNLFAAAAATLQGICDFSVHQWVDETVLPSLLVDDAEQTRQHVSLDCNRIKTRRWVWLALTSAFKAAIAVYCISTLFDDCTAGAGLDNSDCEASAYGSDARTFHCETLRNNLLAVASDKTGQLRKFTIWLLVVLGVATDPTDEPCKKFIRGELKWISENVGTTSPLIAIEVLDKAWQVSCAKGGDEYVKWGSIFEKPCIFAM